MSKRILGLDLGTNSIGWAVVDEAKEEIVNAGVRIFPEGVVSKTIGSGDKEETKNAARRRARQTRRQFYRKRLRKAKLLEVLIEQNMCPLSLDELNKWRHWDKKEKSQAKVFPNSDEFMNWIRMNPYELRARAIIGTVTAMELGRIFYHLIQRRGFLSSRKGDVKESKTLFEKGKPELNILPINRTEKEIAESGCQTMGEYLNRVVPKEGESYKPILDSDGNEIRARGRYATRKMYVEEFEAIWNAQADHLGLDKRSVLFKKVRMLKGNENSERNKKRISTLKKFYGAENVFVENRGNNLHITTTRTLPFKIFLAGDDVELKRNESVLFWQRPLRSQKGTLGNCSFEDTLPVINMDGTQRKNEKGKPVTYSKKPCPISHPLFELFRTHQFINTIEFGEKQRLSKDQKKQVLELINRKDNAFSFKEIVKKLELFSETFNYENDFKVSGNYTISKLSKLLGKKVWDEHPLAYWEAFYFYDDSTKLQKKLNKAYGLNLKVEEVDKIRLKEGYSRVSIKAIQNILPFLEKGYFYSTAVILGGVKNAFGSRWDSYLQDETKDKIEDDILKMLKDKNKEGELIEKIKAYLSDSSNRYGFSENSPAFKKLYHHSQSVEKKELKNKLPPVENIRNPIVQQSLYEMRKVVNALLEKYKEEDPTFSFSSIRVEMGRDLKNGKKQRQKINQVIRKNRENNDEARERLAEFGLQPSRNNIQKYLLFKEMERRAGHVQSPYTGRTISLTDLLGKDNLIQIEHIMPFSKSLNDSFANKTLCESSVNGLKGDKTPYAFYHQNPDPKIWGVSSWDEVKHRAFKLLPYAKAKRFVSDKSVDAEDFISRQLNDTRYIAKKATEILSEICSDVQVMPGQLTAELRHLWGLNNVLESSFGVTKQFSDIPLKPGEYYLVLNEQRESIQLIPKHNPKPKTNPNELLVAGEINNAIFESKKLVLELGAPDQANGKYWAKLTLKPIQKFSPKYISKPITDENRIVFKGLVKNQRFSSDSIPKNPIAEHKDGIYWGSFAVKNKRIERSTVAPITNRKEIKLFGEVKDGIFKSYIYECSTTAENGKYWLVLEPDFETPEFIQASNPEPQHSENEHIITGTIDDNGVFVSDLDPSYSVKTDHSAGKYYAVIELASKENDFYLMENPAPKVEKEHRLIEGTVWVDKYSSELKFDPKKNREDQRHHAIDAITIALTKRGYLNALSHYRAKELPEDYKPSFPEPWDGFEHDVKNAAEKILISYRKNDRIISKGKKGFSVRGQLHKENVFGKHKGKEDEKKSFYHRRKYLNDLKTNKHVSKIVDERIKQLVLDHLKNSCGVNISSEKGFKIPPNAFFTKDGKPRLFLPPNPRKKKNSQPVPIKKVRIKEEIGNARQLKNGINQYVNPRNNHHVMVYKTHSGDVKESIISFWDAVNRMKKNQSVYQLPEDGVEILAVLEQNDMYLIGITDEELEKRKNDQKFLSNHLYRVQKLSSMYYTFRHHLASTVTNPDEEERIVSFDRFQLRNPKKVKISELGEISLC